MRRKDVLSFAAAVLLACVVLLPLLGRRPLTDWDEGIYAEIAREMLSGGSRSLLVPHWNGQLWFEKPPLLLWATAASLRIFGLTTLAARLPSTIAAIMAVGLLHGWLRSRFNELSAWFSTMLLLSAFGFQHAARVGETDTLLGLGCLVGLIGLAEVTAGRRGGWWLFWSGFAVALMTKGAASLVLPLTALGVALAWRRSLRCGRAFWLGFGLFLALVLPWHVWMYAHFGQAFLREYLGFHVFGRATGAIEGHSTRPWFYLVVLLVSAPPFALLYPWSMAASFRRPELRPLRPFAFFALVGLGLFTAAQTRLPHYIAPLYPPLSALTGAWLALRLRPWLPLRRTQAIGLTLVVAALYAMAAGITARARRGLHSAHLPNGFSTPDNRESVMLLRQTRLPARMVSGPLLVLRRGAVVPVTTDAFYAQRLVKQVDLDPPEAALDRYYSSPEPLDAALKGGAPRLILMDTSLASSLPAMYQMETLGTGPTQLVAILTAVQR